MLLENYHKSDMTSISEFYKTGRRIVKPYKLSQGNAITVQDLFEKVIVNNLPSKETVIGWHRLLMRYVDDPRAVFFIRKHGSYSKKYYDKQRRGMETKCQDGFNFVFVDNFFVQVIALMAINNFVPDYDDFMEYVLSKTIPCHGFAPVGAEKLHANFANHIRTTINSTRNYYIAHILSVNESYSIDYNRCNEVIFSCGEANEWNNNIHTRILNNNFSNEEKKIFKAHFLRFVHPINYFLVPKDSFSSIKKIGEKDELIEYMYRYISGIYGNFFEEFCNNVLSAYKISDKDTNMISSTVINLEYGRHIKRGTNKDDVSDKAISTHYVEIENSDFDEIKVGILVNKDLRNLLKSGKIPEEIVKKMLDKAGSFELFHISFPFLSNGDNMQKERYYKDGVVINGNVYYLCSQFYPRQRKYVVEFFNRYK